MTSLALTLALAAGAFAGCGSSHSGGSSADPAGVVPATAPIYAGADVRPQDPERSAALAAGHALTHQSDPYLRLVQALQTPGSPTLSFARDVAPWLGPHAGIFLSSLSGSSSLLPLLEQGLLGRATAAGAFPFGPSGAQGAIVLDTTDATKARSFLDTQAQHAGAHGTTYKGVSYQATSSGIAFGLVDKLAVIGSESGLRSVIDTATGGPALAHAAGYAKLLAAAPAGAIGHIYSNPEAGAQEGASAQAASGLLRLFTGSREANVSLVPTASSLAIDADTIATAATGTPGGLLSSSVEGAQALGELPGESWLAIGLAHLGSALSPDIAGLRELAAVVNSLGPPAPAASSSPFSVKLLLEGLLTPLSVLAADTPQAKRAFTSWMGSGGVYASGASLLELKGAVVIESKNPALSRAAVTVLGSQLSSRGTSVQTASIPGTDAAIAAKVSGLPVVLYIADGRDASGGTKFVLGLGEASVTSALAPSSTFASSSARSAASSALGEGLQPSLAFNLPTLLGLLEGVGLTEDPTLSKLTPYLHAVSTIAGGGHQLGGEVERFRLVVGLQ